MKTIIFLVLVLAINSLIFAQSSGQIIYNDFDPDISTFYYYNADSTNLFPFDSLKIDINDDDIFDIVFYFETPRPEWIHPMIKPNQLNVSICVAKNDTLTNPENVWLIGAYNWDWYYGREKFGLKFTDQDNVYYGWFHAYQTYSGVLENNTRTLWVDKMAYCTIPNYQLLWGQTEISNSVPKTDVDNNGVIINFNNASNTVQVESLTKINEVEIISSSGQVANKTKNVGKNETEINVTDLQNGVYIVKVSLDNGRVVSGKIVR